LSPQEFAQLQGRPGSQSRDKVKFDVVGNAVEFPRQVQIPPASPFEVLSPETQMPVIVGNDGDAFVGEGIRFINGADSAHDPIYGGPPLGGLALQVSSSDVTFTGITFERFIVAMQANDMIVLPNNMANRDLPSSIGHWTSIWIASSMRTLRSDLACTAAWARTWRSSKSARRCRNGCLAFRTSSLAPPIASRSSLGP
jgi:hypothetical protein